MRQEQFLNDFNVFIGRFADFIMDNGDIVSAEDFEDLFAYLDNFKKIHDELVILINKY